MCESNPCVYWGNNRLPHIDGKCVMDGWCCSVTMCLSSLCGGKENRGEAEEGGSAGTSWRTRRGQGTPHNEGMCGECLSGRIAALRTILSAVIKGRQVPILSVTQGFHLNVPLPWKLTLLTLLPPHVPVKTCYENNECLPAVVMSAGSSHRRWCHPRCLPPGHARAL